MICLSSAGSLTPFDGELHKGTRQQYVATRTRHRHVCTRSSRRGHVHAHSRFKRPRRLQTRGEPPATMTGLRRPSTPAETPRTSLDLRRGRRARKRATSSPLEPMRRDAPHEGRRRTATVTSGPSANAPLRISREMRARARRAEQRWKLHSKECASRRNLKAPYAFKGLMIH